MKAKLFLFIMLLALNSFAQNEAFEFNKKLGKGINMGNMFEAPDENTWSNQWKEEYFPIIKNLGFSHVRIPIRWEPSNRSMDTAPYTIYTSFLERIKYVVDQALKNKLIAIINMHHHEALYDDPDGQTERFLKGWEQIATYFKDYSDSIVFEVLNEPHGNLNTTKWNELSELAVNKIRENNPSRYILIGTAEYGGIGGLSKLVLPKDDHLILTVHYYNPFKFTHQGASGVGSQSNDWVGTKWLNTEAERETIQSEFEGVKNYSSTNNIPVHIGEFGAYEKADMDSRVRWTNYLARYFEECGFSWAYWEFSAGFGIYNKTTQTVKQNLADALLNDPMYAITEFYSKQIFKSEFADTDSSWKLYTQQGAVADKEFTDGKLRVDVTNGSTKSWYVQLMKFNINLEKGKMYRLKFKASANIDRKFTVYCGKNSDPWTAYSGGFGFQTTKDAKEYTLFFQMLNDTDSKSRIVFDLGEATGVFSLDDVEFSEMSMTPYSNTDTNIIKLKPNHLIVFPNPTKDYLYYNYAGNLKEITITNIAGQKVSQYLHHDYSEYFINVSNLKKGIYLFIPNNTMIETTKFCKIN